MTYNSAGFAFLCTAVLFGLASTPLFRAADKPPSPQPNRLTTLDGLRGFLALAVCFHHADIYHRYLLTGHWDKPSSHFYALLGSVGVQFFFMITAYLFWSRILRREGRLGWSSLYLGRIFRIGPLYAFCFACVALISLERTGFSLHVAPLALFEQLAVGMSLGVITLRSINTYNSSLLLDYVTWSLQMEWGFYLSLPLLALAARRKNLEPYFLLAALAGSLVLVGFLAPWGQHPNLTIYHVAGIVALFLMGMLVASVSGRVARLNLHDHLKSTLVCVMMGALYFFQSPYNVAALALIGATFFLIVSGCSIFGILLSRPARRLGDISYGIYLLQGLPQAFFFRPAILKSFALSSPLGHWTLALLASITLIFFALFTHVAIEIPGIELGKRVTNAFKKTPTRQVTTTKML